VQLLHALAKTRAAFDDPNLVSRAGLGPDHGPRAAHRTARTDRRARPPGRRRGREPGAEGRVPDGRDGRRRRLHRRHGPSPPRRDRQDLRRDPRTVHPRLVPALLHLGKRQPAAESPPGAPEEPRRDGTAAAGAETLAFVDIDSTQNRVYGYQKQGAKFGRHAKIAGKSLLVKGLNVLAGVVSTRCPRRSSPQPGCAAAAPDPPAAPPAW
jgi:hypothetical protein